MVRVIKKFLLPVLLVLFVTGRNLPAQDMTLGVLYIEPSSGGSSQLNSQDINALSLALNEMIISDLSRLRILKLVERERLNLVIKEQSLALSGLLDESSAARAGELLGARYLLTGSLVFTANIVTLSVRITQAETGEITAAASKSGETKRLFTLQEEVLEELVTAWDLPLSRSEWALLTRRDSVPLEGLISLGNALDAADKGNYETALTYLSAAVRLSPGFELAGALKEELQSRFDRYLRNREEGLPGEILEKIDLLAGGDAKAEQDVLKMYWAFIQPLSLANGYYGSWAAMDTTTRDWFFDNQIQKSWGQMGLTEEPASMKDVELFLGKKIYTAHRILEYLLEKNIPVERYSGYMHPVEGMMGYFLTLFAAVSTGPWQFPPMINPRGEIMVNANQYPPLLLRYCDMFLSNFPYSAYAGMITPMMHTLLNQMEIPAD